MDSVSPDQRRIQNASQNTRRVIRLGGLWMLLCILLNLLGAALTAMAPLGIITHPPLAYAILAVLIAVAAIPLGLFMFGYLSRSKTRLGHWAITTFGGALFFGFSLASFGWAVPAMTTVYAPHQSTQVMTITGTSRSSLSRLGCRHGAFFGTLLRPNGYICMDRISPHGRKGWVLALEGDGNGWATRINHFAGVR